ncbi:hypothetical protein [Corynebacterium sputi]|nr:hypothetical protein [Corynebacterium sputi]
MTLDAIETKYEHHGKSVEFVGANDYTTAFHARPSAGSGPATKTLD